MHTEKSRRLEASDISTFVSLVNPLMAENQTLRQVIQQDALEHEAAVVLKKFSSSGERATKARDKFLASIDNPEKRKRMLKERAGFEFAALVSLFFSGNPDDRKTISEYILRVVEEGQDEVEAVVVEEPSKAIDMSEGASEVEEKNKSEDQEEDDGGGQEEAVAVEKSNANPPRTFGPPEDRETVPFTLENVAEISTNQSSRVAQVFADSELDKNQIWKILESAFEKAGQGRYVYKDKTHTYEISLEELDAIVIQIMKAREKNPKLQGVGFKKLLERAGLDMKLLAIFRDPVILATMLQEYAFIKEPEEEIEMPAEVKQGEPTPAELAEELAGDFEAPKTGGEIAAEPEADDEVEPIVLTAADLAKVDEKPESETQALVIEAEDLEEETSVTTEREPVTVEQFIAQIEGQESSNLFRSKFYNNPEQKKFIADQLAQYSAGEISRQELIDSLIKKAKEIDGVHIWVGTEEPKPEMVTAFFDKLLGSESEEKNRRPLLSGNGGEALLSTLGNLARQVVPSKQRVWGAVTGVFKKKSPEEQRLADLQRLGMSEEDARAHIEKKKAEKGEAPPAEVATQAEETVAEGGSEKVPAEVIQGYKALVKDRQEELPQYFFDALTEAAGKAYFMKLAEAFQLVTLSLRGESVDDELNGDQKVPDEVIKGYKALVRERQEELPQYFFDALTEAAGKPYFKKLAEAFQLVTQRLVKESEDSE